MGASNGCGGSRDAAGGQAEVPRGEVAAMAAEEGDAAPAENAKTEEEEEESAKAASSAEVVEEAPPASVDSADDGCGRPKTDQDAPMDLTTSHGNDDGMDVDECNKKWESTGSEKNVKSSISLEHAMLAELTASQQRDPYEVTPREARTPESSGTTADTSYLYQNHHQQHHQHGHNPHNFYGNTYSMRVVTPTMDYEEDLLEEATKIPKSETSPVGGYNY